MDIARKSITESRSQGRTGIKIPSTVVLLSTKTLVAFSAAAAVVVVVFVGILAPRHSSGRQ